MSHIVREVISDAYSLSGIVSLDFNVLTGPQSARGLKLLNTLLNLPYVKPELIPFYTKYTFDCVAGTEKYTIPNLVQPATLIFYLDNVRITSTQVGRDLFFGGNRVDGVQSIPFSGRFERVLSGYDLYFYFVPDKDYSIEIWGRFSLSSVDYEDDLEQALPKIYIEYLTNKLAEWLCNYYSQSIPPGLSMEVTRLENAVKNISTPDLTCGVVSTIDAQSSNINWAYVNLGNGWWPE